MTNEELLKCLTDVRDTGGASLTSEQIKELYALGYIEPKSWNKE